ncbi:MAG TPA: four helix bundle protein [Parafilimonas sp.]|nr:four helix bundle protein [Parafilimonas sp.]
MESEYLLEEPQKTYNIKYRAFQFSKDILSFVSKTKFEKIFYSIFDQLVRSATSIGANLVEAKAGATKKDFLNFYVIALKSANETKYWLCLIRDSIESDKNKLAELLQEADELSKIIASIIISVKQA